jgi:hypothetical protein
LGASRIPVRHDGSGGHHGGMAIDDPLSPESAWRLGELSNMAQSLSPELRARLGAAIHEVMQRPTAESAFTLVVVLRESGLDW